MSLKSEPPHLPSPLTVSYTELGQFLVICELRVAAFNGLTAWGCLYKNASDRVHLILNHVC